MVEPNVFVIDTETSVGSTLSGDIWVLSSNKTNKPSVPIQLGSIILNLKRLKRRIVTLEAEFPSGNLDCGAGSDPPRLPPH